MIAIIPAAVAVILIAALFMRLYPPFGGTPSAAERAAIGRSANRAGKKFVNLIPTSMMTGSKEKLGVLAEFIKGNPKAKPRLPVGVMPWKPLNPPPDDGHVRVTWLGHSAVIVEISGLTLLLDPMLGKAPSPFPFIGGKRFSRALPVGIDELPPIDAVIYSHDHYDHLDYFTIKRLKHKAKRFIVPLGVGAHLRRWGVSAERISEHDWWQELDFAGLKLACTPARHFSGRSVTDRDSTLWCSWVIASGSTNLFFSGDSGYGPHFKRIGERYGPFDLALMECGQYDERWKAIHMLPEETVQACLDVRGKLLIPIHWGAFTLALHDWTDPVERLLKASAESGVGASTPRIGEPVVIGGSGADSEQSGRSATFPTEKWWR